MEIKTPTLGEQRQSRESSRGVGRLTRFLTFMSITGTVVTGSAALIPEQLNQAAITLGATPQVMEVIQSVEKVSAPYAVLFGIMALWNVGTIIRARLK